MLASVRQYSRAQLCAAACMAMMALGVPVLASAETETVDRTVPIASGGRLVVKNFSGRIDIAGSARHDVSIRAVRRASRDRLDRIKLDITSDGTTVTIQANRRADDDRKHNDDVVETDLTIEVPREVDVDVDAFSSPVTVHDVSGTNHRLKTFSGDVTAERVGGGIQAETFSGRIVFRPGDGGNGERVGLKTFSGDVTLSLPQQAALSLAFDTFSGDFESNAPVAIRSKSGRAVRADYNAGAAGTHRDVTIKTFSGDAHIER